MNESNVTDGDLNDHRVVCLDRCELEGLEAGDELRLESSGDPLLRLASEHDVSVDTKEARLGLAGLAGRFHQVVYERRDVLRLASFEGPSGLSSVVTSRLEAIEPGDDATVFWGWKYIHCVTLPFGRWVRKSLVIVTRRRR